MMLNRAGYANDSFGIESTVDGEYTASSLIKIKRAIYEAADPEKLDSSIVH